MPIVDDPKTIDLTAFNAYWTFSPSSGIAADGPSRPFNNTAPPSPANFAWITDDGTIEQAFTTTVAGVHTIAFQHENRFFPAATQKVFVYIDGVGAGTIFPGPSNVWTAQSIPTPSSLTPGPHTLRFAGVGVTGQTGLTMFIDSVTITGPPPGNVAVTLLNPSFDGYLLSPDGIIANPPVTATASLHADATVSTCGTLLEIFITPIGGGSPINSGSINQAPTVQINGVDAGPLRTFAPSLLSTPAHPSFLVRFPSGVVALPSDVVTITAPAGWFFGPSGYAEAMSGQAVPNYAGRSFVRTIDVPRTMAVGASYAHHVTAEWHSGFLPKNQRYRCAFWEPANLSEDVLRNPRILGAAASIAPIVAANGVSYIDDTGMPTPAGYSAVRWDDLDGHTSYSLTNNGAVNTSCTEVTSLANPGVGGLGKVRVFDFQPTGVIDAANYLFLTNLRMWLQLDSGNPDHSVHFDNLAILAPGDFAWTAGQPTVIPMPLWSDVSAIVEAKLPPSLPFGPHRMPTAGIELGESSACEREDLVEPDDFHWAQDVKRRLDIGYIQARPWTNAGSPYIYDPLAGTDYPATLAAPIVTAPASGTIETITLAQVGDGAIFAGLVLTIDSEKFRVMAAPTGPTTALVTSVMRGIASTVPALHPISPPLVKTISVSARRPMASLAAFGPSNQQVTELVTQSPHGLKTGQIVKMDGGGWPVFTYTDGRGFRGTWFVNYKFVTYITGANTFVTIGNGFPGTNPSNTTLSTTYTLDPAQCLSTLYLPEYGGVPYEIAATTAAKHPGAPARVTFCMVASDDMVDSIWRRILAYLPADRDVYVEDGDEPWNGFGVPGSYWNTMTFLLYGAVSPTLWYGVRVGQIRARGRAIWAAAGRDPSHVKSTLNIQDSPGNDGSISGTLDFLAARSAVPDLVEIAPYYDHYSVPAIWAAYAAWSTAELVDLWIWDFYRNTSVGARNWGGGQVHRTGDFKRAIDNWNNAQTPTGNVGLGIYEYGPGRPWPVYTVSASGGTVGLGAAMDATTTTLVLPNANVYDPLDDNWDDCAKVCPGTWLKVESEWMTVVSRSGVNCTVNRRQGGTTAAAHAAGLYLSNDWLEGIRDLTLHPNYRIAHRDVLEFFQAIGVSICIPSSLDQEWSGGTGWSDYHGIGQPPGMGDGSDGKADNRLCLARRGQTHSKLATVNQDANTVSTRGQAMIDFLSAAAAPPITPTPPTPTTAGRRWLESGASRLLESGEPRTLESVRVLAPGTIAAYPDPFKATIVV